METISSHRMCSIVLASLAALSAGGCATVARPLAADQPDEWAGRIQSVPVDLHGVIPQQTEAQTVAAIDHGVDGKPDTKFERTGLGLDSVPRVVVYIGGGAVPARDRYCARGSAANR